MTKQKDKDNEPSKRAPNNPNNPMNLDRAQIIRDIMIFAECSEAEAEEVWERLLETARKK